MLPKKILENYYTKFDFLKTEFEFFLSEYDEKQNHFSKKFQFKNIELILIHDDVNQALDKINIKTDIWYLDGFDPKKNPEMWSEKMFRYIEKHSKENASLSTYSVSKSVKDNLKNSGFEIQKVKGFGKKREILYANFSKKKFYLKDKIWFFYPKIEFQDKKITIIGSGLAGSNLAYLFSETGFEVDVFEKESSISSRTSSNPCAIFAPQIYKKESFESIWYEKAFSEFQNFLPKLPISIYEIIGAKEIFKDKNLYKKNSSNEIDFEKYENSVYYKKAGYIYPKELNEFLLSQKKISIHLNSEINQIEFVNGKWNLYSNQKLIHQTEILIFANSFYLNQFESNKIDELYSSRGQVLIFEKKTDEILLEEDFYLSKLNEKLSLIGSTFNPVEKSEKILDTETEILKRRFYSKFSNGKISDSNSSWVGFRANTKDHLPILGLLPSFLDCKKIYSTLWKGNQYLEYEKPVHQRNLFVLTGLGSKGILNSHLGAKLVFDIVLNQFNFPKEFYDKTNPIRFLIQKLIRKDLE